MSQALLLTYFVYGLAFFAMGLAMLLETGRSPALAEARNLRFLASFGIIHGTHEWLESYMLQAQAAGTPLAPWLAWIRLALLISSFVALFLYAYLTSDSSSPRYHARRLLHFDRLAIYEGVILLVVLFSYRERPDRLDQPSGCTGALSDGGAGSGSGGAGALQPGTQIPA